MMGWLIEGGAVLGAGGLRPGGLALAEGCVAEAAPEGARRLDAAGCWVLPGIVDIHGDAHERALQPRPGVGFGPDFALRDTAAQLLAAGITTAYLGVTLSWEPGLRSLDMFRALLAAPRPTAPDMRLHLRFEADNLGALDVALAAIAEGQVHLLGYNDHTPGIARKVSDAMQLAKYAGRAGVSDAVFRDLVDTAMASRPGVPAAQAALAAAARGAGIPMLSHDDPHIEQRAAFRALGAGICEFPITEAVAENARSHGEHVVMGAPNVVRGGSHMGWASAAPLAERGLVTVLASDYHWPALFAAPFVMLRRGVLDVAGAWALVSRNPAEALGLTDRGGLMPGQRGDAVLVAGNAEAPRLVAVFVAGHLAWIAPGEAERMSRDGPTKR
jgi:alpha-D-ribose 1-methylphosphonate 5-triphosphate diphosphatase